MGKIIFSFQVEGGGGETELYTSQKSTRTKKVKVSYCPWRTWRSSGRCGRRRSSRRHHRPRRPPPQPEQKGFEFTKQTNN